MPPGSGYDLRAENRALVLKKIAGHRCRKDLPVDFILLPHSDWDSSSNEGARISRLHQVVNVIGIVFCDCIVFELPATIPGHRILSYVVACDTAALVD